MVASLAATYWLTGKLGQLVAIPPGYATVIWPPGGIMLAALLMHGRRLWPGVLLGAFLLNLTNGDLALADMLRSHALLLATCISAGQTLQVVLACEVITRRFGRPIRLASTASAASPPTTATSRSGCGWHWRHRRRAPPR